MAWSKHIFLPKIINNQLNKIFHEGNLEGEFNIPFKKDGSVDDNYGFNGKVSNASLNLNREFSIQNFGGRDISVLPEDLEKLLKHLHKLGLWKR